LNQKRGGYFSTLFKSQSGTVESALVLIPTILLFLSVLQIAASVLGRGVAVNQLQGEVSRAALFGSSSMNSTNQRSSPEISRQTLPGGGAVVIGSQRVLIPTLTPLLMFQDKFLVKGIAIDENQ